MLDLGYDAIGRPSCLGAIWQTVEFIRQRWPLDVVIVGDVDGPGRRGAEQLAGEIIAVCKSLKVMYPPSQFKDMREWKLRGASAGDVQAIIEKTAIREIHVQETPR